MWNFELLHTAGLICRIIYNDDLEEISKIYNAIVGPKNNNETMLWLHKKASHAMSSFTFRTSTPSSLVGNIISDSFNKCSSNNLMVMSTRGIISIEKVRIFSKGIETDLLKQFVKNVPIFPEFIVNSCDLLISQFQKAGKLTNFGVSDVIEELSSRVLEIDEFIAFLKWFIFYRSSNNVSQFEMAKISNVAIINCQNQKENDSLEKPTKKSKPLSFFKYYLNPKVITPGMDLPDNVIPYEISKHFTKPEMEIAI